jgi:hypothetical protein
VLLWLDLRKWLGLESITGCSFLGMVFPITGAAVFLATCDAVERVKLRREAERLKNVVEIQPCQRVSDYVLREK